MTGPPLSLNARLRWDAVERHLTDLPMPARILELGAGGGAAGFRLAQLGTYVGVEPDATSRETARSRLPDDALVVDSIEAVQPRNFDLVCAFEVIEHLEDDLGELQRWLAHLKPGGLVLVSVPAYRRRYATADKIVGHYRRYDPDDLVGLLAASGLSDVQVDLYGFPLGFPLEWARNLLAVPEAKGLRTDRAKDMEQRTARSGRIGQPDPWMTPAIEMATYPFRVMQRMPWWGNLGTGLIGRARQPS